MHYVMCDVMHDEVACSFMTAAGLYSFVAAIVYVMIRITWYYAIRSLSALTLRRTESLLIFILSTIVTTEASGSPAVHRPVQQVMGPHSLV